MFSSGLIFTEKLFFNGSLGFRLGIFNTLEYTEKKGTREYI